MPEQESSSSQSTSQSHSTQKSQPAGENGSDRRVIEDHGNPSFSSGLHGAFSAQNPDYRQLALNSSGVNGVPYTYDPYYGGFMAAYGAHSFQTDQQMAADGPAIVNARVPLPIELAEAEPVYVNAKQYHRILRRRQLRAKLEAQNKVVKERKPYLHESRHLHAVKRARGSGGRFLNSKAQEGSSEEQKKEDLERENPGNSANSTSSDTTSASDGNVFRASDGGAEMVAQRQVSVAR